MGHALPEASVRLDALPALAEPAGDRERTLRGLGIETVRVAEGTDATELAERAAREALRRGGIDGPELGGLIVVEQRAPGKLLSSEVTRLQRLLGAERALAFSVGGLGCVSVTPALLAARGLLAADPDLRDVLVVHGSTPASPYRYRHPVTVNGDGGQALLVSRSGALRVLDIAQETNGAYWDLFHVDYRDRPSAEWREECADLPGYSFRLAVETRDRLTAMLRTLLERNGMTPADVRGYVSQNLSAGGHAFTEEVLGIELLGVCRENLRRYGHLGPNDVFLNLHTALERGEFTEGDRVVVINVSPVAAWSLLLIETRPREAMA
ncbi:3-oxoacyl-[acyl-carrier-protein] synthase III C-terminal domain-containing protein [Streptomyces niveiscabiei]|uniref:3-oxoacyl-[acyl-carrier-protein] synthase III C-terminal domain-containing protein n=1 Tax=Streptomyces niveiscabiei TaxID=164115 RepID=UPI001F0ACC1F|nr:3-oxoacyl-[acyl-carrier-protein] synthase III C-terminal domain-containing protein [Streptomyces niveiscabiei]